MVVEPLPTLAVGEEAVARSTLGRALERGLTMKNNGQSSLLKLFSQTKDLRSIFTIKGL